MISINAKGVSRDAVASLDKYTLPSNWRMPKNGKRKSGSAFRIGIDFLYSHSAKTQNARLRKRRLTGSINTTKANTKKNDAIARKKKIIEKTKLRNEFIYVL